MTTKQIYVNIQIDNVTTKELVDIEEKLEQALEDYPQNRINISISDLPRSEVPPKIPTER